MLTPVGIRVAAKITEMYDIVLQLDPKTVWMKDTTGRCYFPRDNEFQLEEEVYTLIVEGAPPLADRYVSACVCVRATGTV